MQLNLSESARVTTAAEARFRVDYPNSSPRATRVIALDDTSLAALTALKDHPWNGARFLRYVESRPVTESLPQLPIDALLVDVDGKPAKLSDEVAAADVIVMVTAAGSASEAAEIIGNACFVRGKRATGLVLTKLDDLFELEGGDR